MLDSKLHRYQCWDFHGLGLGIPKVISVDVEIEDAFEKNASCKVVLLVFHPVED